MRGPGLVWKSSLLRLSTLLSSSQELSLWAGREIERTEIEIEMHAIMSVMLR